MNLYIFDCFGVLMPDTATEWFFKRYGALEGAALKKRYFDSADRDGTTIDSLVARLERDLRVPASVIWQEWSELTVINNELLQTIRSLKDGHRTALLSNAPSGIQERIFKKFGLSDFFDVTVVSGDVRIAKPDPAIYKLCTQAFCERFDGIYMIDDNPVNLQAAQNLGMIPHLYRNNSELILFLRGTI